MDTLFHFADEKTKIRKIKEPPTAILSQEPKVRDFLLPFLRLMLKCSRLGVQGLGRTGYEMGVKNRVWDGLLGLGGWSFEGCLISPNSCCSKNVSYKQEL